MAYKETTRAQWGVAADAWAEIEEALGQFEHDGRFEGPCEMLVAVATK